MKNVKVSLAALFMTVFAITSCSSDDSDGPAANIVGKWTQTRTVTKVGNAGNITQNYDENTVGCDKDYIEFTVAGSFNDVIYFKNASNVCEADAAPASTYTKTDNLLTITSGDFEGVYAIEKLSGSQLAIKAIENVGGNEITTTTYFGKVAATN